MSINGHPHTPLAEVARTERARRNDSLQVAELKKITLALLHEVESLAAVHNGHATHERFNLEDEVRQYESELIRADLAQTGGNQRRAAHLLGVKVTTLNSKIKRYRM